MKKKLILVIICLFILKLNVFGLEASITLSCPSSGKVNDTITCNVTGNATSGEVSSLSAVIELSGNLEFQSFTKSSIWEGDGNNGNIDLYTDSNKSGSFNIGTFVVKINNNTTNPGVVTLKSITLFDTGFVPKNISNQSDSINILSDVNTLSALSTNVGTLSPVFSSSTLTYSITVPSTTTSITVNATKSNSNSSMTGTGTKNLNYGLNSLKVVVTSESGISKTYTLNVTRTDNRSTNNNLSTLEVENTKITFSSTRTEYTDTVANNVDKIVIKATKSDDKATMTGIGTYNLVVGLNSFVVTVTAENGSKKEYKINVTRQEILEQDYLKENRLKSLTIDNIEFTFNKDNLEYYFDVSDNVKTANLHYEPINKDEKIEIIGNTNLEYGKNTIKIKVTALNKAVLEYVLVIQRRENENVVKYDEGNILKAINDSTKNMVVVLSNVVKDKLVQSSIIESLIEKKSSIRYDIVDDKGNVTYSVIIDGNKINNVTSYTDIYLDFENKDIENKLNKKSNYLVLDFLRDETIDGNIKYEIHQDIFKDNKTLYLYDSNLKYIDEVKVEDGVINIELNDFKDYVLLDKKVSNFNILFIVIPVIGVGIILTIIYLFIIKKKIRVKVKNILKDKIDEIKDSN